MNHEEYALRRRTLEEHLQADLDLIRAGYRAKLQALEMLWLTSGVSAEPLCPDPSAVSTTHETHGETQDEGETRDPVAAETRETRRIGSAHDEIEAVLPRLPDTFDKRDVVRALGWEPHRATLYRALLQLRTEKKIAIQSASEGRHATRYRKAGSD